jgi:D-alanyl-D-alanine endopeptidase (penicillin-binding protein 7)
MPYFLLLLLFYLAVPAPLLAANAPILKARHALVMDEYGGTLFSKNADSQTPIASITKLMTAMVVLDGKQNMNKVLTITKADRDRLKKTGSRLKYGARLTREQMLVIALSASENRAAHVLARYYPGGERAFVSAMNAKAQLLSMSNTRFRDPTGLNPGNISTARDLAMMVDAAMDYPFIRKASTTKQTYVWPFRNGKAMEYNVTNLLLRNNNYDWTIYLSKTGYIKEAGRCLVMRAKTAGRTVTIVLLNAYGKYTTYGDSNRIRKWLLNDSEFVWLH